MHLRNIGMGPWKKSTNETYEWGVLVIVFMNLFSIHDELYSTSTSKIKIYQILKIYLIFIKKNVGYKIRLQYTSGLISLHGESFYIFWNELR
jgi:hypothetical protein